MKQLGSGMLATLSIFVFTFIILASSWTFDCGSENVTVCSASVDCKNFTFSIMRGTPLMLQLLVVFFAPYYVFGISTPYMYRLYAVIIGFSLNYAAYFAEIYRSGIQRYSAGTARSGTGHGIRQTPDVFSVLFSHRWSNASCRR